MRKRSVICGNRALFASSIEKQFKPLRFLFAFTVSLLLLNTTFAANITYDSLSWYSKHKIEFARWTHSGIQVEYHFYDNGHVQDITRTSSGRLLTRYEFYPNGERKFDTICMENYYNWSWTYYPNGARKRFVQQQFPSSYSSSHTRFEIIEWDEAGEVSLLLQKDEQDHIVANETYPFRKYQKLQLEQKFNFQGQLIAHNFYTVDPQDGSHLLQGCSATFYDSGKLKSIGLFMDNKAYGIHYEYYENGTLLSVKNFVAGKEVGFAPNDLAPAESSTNGLQFPSWRWKNFTSEGLVAQPGQTEPILNYFYRGMNIVCVNWLSKSKQNDLNLEFGFIATPYWSSYTQYRVEFKNSKIIREHEMMNGSWTTNRIFNEQGIPVWSYNCSSRQITVRSPKGSVISRESQYRSDEVRTPSGFLVSGGMNDSSITYDASGRIAATVVYGLYGQKYCSNIYSEGKIVSSEVNPSYARLFVTVAPGHTIEVLDDDVLLPGYYEKRDMKNNLVACGRIESLRDGLWIEYSLQSGRKKLVQYYNDGMPKGKGIYREYYDNGNPSIRGTYGDNQEQIGVWKTYDIHGRLASRTHYKKGKVTGFEYCSKCCLNKHGRYRGQITLHWKNRQIRFKKCRPRVDPFWGD